MVLVLSELHQLRRQKINSDCTYTRPVETFNITTEYMSDDCNPYEIGSGGVIWLNAVGAMGEVEFIYPRAIHKPSIFEAKQNINGTPLFTLTALEYAKPYIQLFEDGFIIWLQETTDIELEISYGKVSYLISNNVLCGILAKNPQIIE